MPFLKQFAEKKARTELDQFLREGNRVCTEVSVVWESFDSWTFDIPSDVDPGMRSDIERLGKVLSDAKNLAEKIGL